MNTDKNEKKHPIKGFFSGIKRFFSKKIFSYSLIQIFLLSFLMNLITDSLSRSSLIRSVVFLFQHPLIFLTNMLIIAVLLAPALLFRKRSFFYFLGCLLWLTVGVVDFIVLKNRVTPFNAKDFRMLGDAWNVLLHYYSVIQAVGLGLLILLGVALLVVAYIFFPKRKEKVNYEAALPMTVCIIFGCILLVLGSRSLNIVKKTFPNIADGYHDYGLPYCFVCSIFDIGISKPDDYSSKKVQEVVDQLLPSPTPVPTDSPTGTPTPSVSPDITPEPSPAVSPDSPNIVFIQLESFFDPKRICGIAFETDPIPTFSYLRDKFTSGLLKVPSISAGTSNTEFEILTGMNMADFGAGEYPYKTILKESTCESIAYNLKELGYSTHAIHNNTAGFYSRNIVFSNLGFDDFDSVELMDNVERNELDWARDSVLYGEILTALDSTEGSDLVFTVSVQGHGKYPDEDILENAIDLTDVYDAYSDDTIYGLKYYINQLNEMDQLIKRLMDEFSKREDPYVLVLYGDHLPGFNFNAEDLNRGELLETEYAIWTNFPMTVEHRDLHSYQLSAFLLNKLGINNGLLTKLHQQYLNGISDMEESNYLGELHLLSYDMLYGEKYCWGGTCPYQPTDIVYGLHDVTIEDYKAIYDPNEDVWYLTIYGEHFTEYTDIYINGQRYKNTIPISPTEVFIPNVTLHTGDALSVAMPIDDQKILRGSNALEFDANRTY